MAADEPRTGDSARAIGRRIETWLLTTLLFGIIAMTAAQILLRNFFSYSIFWADELIRLAVLWLAVIGAVAASREGRHIATGIVPRYFPQAWHKPAAVTGMLFAALVTGVLAWQSVHLVHDTWRYRDVVLGDWPAWLFQAVMPVGFALMSYRFVRHGLAALSDKS
jgi:TRAP-type C4-dicarboxylate transport system permease small subunit